MKKTVRLSDIAEKLQVSTVTVSNALAGQKGVSEELRARIKQVAAEMGYQTRGSSGGNGKKILNIGVIIGEKYLGPYPSYYWRDQQKVSGVFRQSAGFAYGYGGFYDAGASGSFCNGR